MQVEARIGFEEWDVSRGLQPITLNEVCDTFGEANNEVVALLTCTEALAGRYLTLQTLVMTFLEVDEVYVHSEYAHTGYKS